MSTIPGDGLDVQASADDELGPAAGGDPGLAAERDRLARTLRDTRLQLAMTQRRLAALSMGSTRLKAAATASALALVQTKLIPGESTDGAVFFPTGGKPLGSGRLVVRTNTDVFEFNEEQAGGHAVPNSEVPER